MMVLISYVGSEHKKGPGRMTFSAIVSWYISCVFQTEQLVLQSCLGCRGCRGDRFPSAPYESDQTHRNEHFPRQFQMDPVRDPSTTVLALRGEKCAVNGVG